MPGQSGSEIRIKQIVRSNRWSENQFSQLQGLARASGCSEAEVLRRLVERASKNIIISNELIVQINRLGNNLNQIAKRLNSDAAVSQSELLQAYRELLAAVRIARS